MNWRSMTAVDRYAAQTRVDDATGCVEWQGALSGGGYAQFNAAGRRVYVHRWAWERVHGQIPAGLYLDHLCRNRRCSNPDHLELVTFAENVLRGISFTAANAVKDRCPRGHHYTPGNTYVNPKGSRVCRRCKRERAPRERDLANARAINTPGSQKAMRAWALANGFPVADRGVVPRRIRDAYMKRAVA